MPLKQYCYCLHLSSVNRYFGLSLEIKKPQGIVKKVR